MNNNALRTLLYMTNSFAKEGVVASFSNEAIEKLLLLFEEYPSNAVVAMIVEAYTELRDDRTFEQWYRCMSMRNFSCPI